MSTVSVVTVYETYTMGGTCGPNAVLTTYTGMCMGSMSNPPPMSTGTGGSSPMTTPGSTQTMSGTGMPGSMTSMMGSVTSNTMSGTGMPSATSTMFGNPTPVVQAVQALQSDLIALNMTLNDFMSGTTNAYDVAIIQNESGTIETAIQNATSVVQNSIPFDYSGATTIGIAFFALEPVVSQVLMNLIAHKPQFESVAVIGNTAPTVEGQLEYQRSLSSMLSSALMQKIPSGLDSTASSIAENIDMQFAAAISAFADSTGVVPVSIPVMTNTLPISTPSVSLPLPTTSLLTIP